MRSLLVGICGGTGAGKTTLARKIVAQFGKQRVSLLDTDSYYVDRSHIPLEKRHHFNFDHPDALDVPLLVSHLQSLKSGDAIEKQVYDFTTHTRKHDTVKVEARDIIVVDGILIFAINEVCELFDIKIFMDEEANVRLLRRLQRDVTERGRTIESVCHQYLETVRPMHITYVEPSKSKSDIVLRHGDSDQIAINAIQRLIKG
jgi:uridine kinase